MWFCAVCILFFLHASFTIFFKNDPCLFCSCCTHGSVGTCHSNVVLSFKLYGVVFIHFLIVHEIVFWDFRHVQLQAFVLPFHVVDAAIGRDNFNRHAPKRRANPVQKASLRAHPDLNQGPADLQSAALTTELCTQVMAC